jgi:hypothetical protein
MKNRVQRCPHNAALHRVADGDFPFFSTESATPVEVLVMPDVFLRITYCIDTHRVHVGRWTDCGFLPRIGDHVNVMSDETCLLDVRRVEHFLDDAVVVLSFAIDVDGGNPGSWNASHSGESFSDFVAEFTSEEGFSPVPEDKYFPDRI